MIEIRIRRDSGRLVIDASGHAQAAPKGQDIVCAAVSAILETARLGLEAVAEKQPAHVRIVRDGPDG